jgi:hypothetical protein
MITATKNEPMIMNASTTFIIVILTKWHSAQMPVL